MVKTIVRLYHLLWRYFTRNYSLTRTIHINHKTSGCADKLTRQVKVTLHLVAYLKHTGQEVYMDGRALGSNPET
jgi:hypothetical protein